ncbi:unnamed protein product [Cunninghamella echinulata]
MTLFANTHLSLSKGLHPRINTTIYHIIHEEKEKDNNNKVEFVTIPLSPPSPYTIATCALDIIYTLPPSLFRPDLEQTHRIIDIPLPKVGWLCQNINKSPSSSSPLSPPTLKEALSFYLNSHPHQNNNNNNQSNNKDWTWISILSSSNMDHHQQDLTSSSSLQIQLPVGNLNDVMIVQWGTIVSILLGTLWILWSVMAAVKKHRRHEAKGKRRKSE